MLEHHRPSCSRLRTCVPYAALAAVALVLAAWNVGRAEEGDNGAVSLLKTIPVPPITANNNTAGALYSFDISWVDQATQTYFFADRSNKAVEVVDAKTGTLLTPLQVNPSPPFMAFAGFVPCPPGAENGAPPGPNDCAGPNGVVRADAPHPWLFVTDAGSRVDCFNAETGETVAQVVTKTGDATRADELAYDSQDGLLLVINNVQFPGHPPFATLISVAKATCALTVVTNIPLDVAHGVDATNGAEQPVWDPDTGRFFLSIPQIGANVKDGGVVRIDPVTATIDATYPVEFCGPAGLTRGPHHDLLIGCNTVFDTVGNVWNPTGTVAAAPKDVILDVKTGSTTDVPGVGAGDEVWFNKGDGNYYATGSGSPLRPLPGATAKGSTPLGVVDAKEQRVVQLVPTYNVPAGSAHPAGTAHSVAVNAKNNYVFVPLAANNAFPDCLTGCVAVYSRPRRDE